MELSTRQKNAATKARMARVRAEAQAIVASGRCPNCSRSLRCNLSLAGWFQCSQFGAVGFRVDADLPSCDFQCFTE